MAKLQQESFKCDLRDFLRLEELQRDYSPPLLFKLLVVHPEVLLHPVDVPRAGDAAAGAAAERGVALGAELVQAVGAGAVHGQGALLRLDRPCWKNGGSLSYF